MAERFTYPPELKQELLLEKKRRRPFWLLFLSPFWAFGIIMPFQDSDSDTRWLGPIGALFITGIVMVMEGCMSGFARRTAELCEQTVEYDGTRLLRQIAPDGRIIAVVDLSAPYMVLSPYHAGGNAVYHVMQSARPNRSVEFSSRINDAEHLVRDILQQSTWPPGSD